MAREIGVHTSTVSNWLDGKEVKAENLASLCSYFSCTLDYLAGQSPTPKKAPTPEGERDLVDAVIFGRDGKRIKRTYSKEQMETVYKLLDAIPHKDEDI